MSKRKKVILTLGVVFLLLVSACVVASVVFRPQLLNHFDQFPPEQDVVMVKNSVSPTGKWDAQLYCNYPSDPDEERFFTVRIREVRSGEKYYPETSFADSEIVANGNVAEIEWISDSEFQVADKTFDAQAIAPGK